MRTQRNEHTDRDQRQRTQEPDRQQEQQSRLNPRLVFNDPDAFFRDLVMEQQEQM